MSVIFSPPPQPQRSTHSARTATHRFMGTRGIGLVFSRGRFAHAESAHAESAVCNATRAGILRARNGLGSFLDGEQLDFEDERGVGRDDVAGAALAVGQVRRNGQLALAADFHAGDAFVPALDHFAPAKRKIERHVAVFAAVELLTVGQPAGVMHLDRVALFRFGAVADLEILVFQAGVGHDFLSFLFLGVGPMLGHNQRQDREQTRQDSHDVSPETERGLRTRIVIVWPASLPPKHSGLIPHGGQVNWISHFDTASSLSTPSTPYRKCPRHRRPRWLQVLRTPGLRKWAKRRARGDGFASCCSRSACLFWPASSARGFTGGSIPGRRRSPPTPCGTPTIPRSARAASRTAPSASPTRPMTSCFWAARCSAPISATWISAWKKGCERGLAGRSASSTCASRPIRRATAC